MNKAKVDHEQIFETIYRANVWGAGSGDGSLEENTREYRIFLQSFLRLNGIKKVLDFGCGDWQFSRHIDWSGIDYLGVDVSETALGLARPFQAANVRFSRASEFQDALPDADLLIVKDVFQHWSNDDIQRFIPEMRRFRYSLVTNGFQRTSPPLADNEDIPAGGWRPIDLTAPPFSLSGAYVFSFFADEDKYVFLLHEPHQSSLR